MTNSSNLFTERFTLNPMIHMDLKKCDDVTCGGDTGECMEPVKKPLIIKYVEIIDNNKKPFYAYISMFFRIPIAYKLSFSLFSKIAVYLLFLLSFII